MARMVRILIPVVWIMLLCCGWTARAEEAEHMKYKDPKQPVGVRIKDLMGRMTLEEKIGQMVQIDRTVATTNIMRDFSIGSVLSGGGSAPLLQASVTDWVNMVNDFQKGSLSSRMGIPMIYGIDAIHGHNNVYKTTIFPHNVGLGVTRQPFADPVVTKCKHYFCEHCALKVVVNAQVVIDKTGLYGKERISWKQVFMLVHSVCCCAVLFPSCGPLRICWKQPGLMGKQQ